MIGDCFDLCWSLGCREGVQVRGGVGRGPGAVGQWMRVAEGLCVASCPPLQVVAGGDVVPGGVYLVGVAADVVVQVEVWIARGGTEIPFERCELQVVEVVGVGEPVDVVVEGLLPVVEDGFFERGEPLDSGVVAEGVGAVGDVLLVLGL